MGYSMDKLNIFLWGLLIFIGAVLFVGPVSLNAAGHYDKWPFDTSAYTTVELKKIIDQHQNEIKVLENQIRSIEKDMDWLVLKINRISDAGRQPASDLTDSVIAKEKKIQYLKKEKARLSALNASYIKTYESQKKSSPTIPSGVKNQILSENINTDINSSHRPSVKKASIEKRIKDLGLDDWVEVAGDGTCLKINTTLPILFSSGSARVAKEYKNFLKKLALFLKPYDIKVVVDGYADTDPIHTKRYPSNLELAASRAANIVHELVKNGLKPSIFKIGTTGEYRFAATQPIKQKSFHRRAQVTVIFAG